MMEEQTTWKGHSFTLLVFTGIVVLSSIFFILGMLVGRQEGQKFASVVSAKNEAKAAPKEDKSDFTFYDSVKKGNEAGLQPAPQPKSDLELKPSSIEPAKKAAPEPEREPAREPAPAAPSGNMISYQIGALRKAADAQKLLDEVKKKGFRAFILEPEKGDSNPYFRVQVGPFTDIVQAETMKKKLESEKYQPILKK
jgi:cell division septation protein DedD